MSVDVLNGFEQHEIGGRQPLPDGYLGLTDAEMDDRIAAARAAVNL